MLITKAELPNTRREHTLYGLAEETITRRLGFTPELEDHSEPGGDPRWAFGASYPTLAKFGVHTAQCAIWSIAGSHRMGTWSAWGDAEVLRMVFPEARIN